MSVGQTLAGMAMFGISLHVGVNAILPEVPLVKGTGYVAEPVAAGEVAPIEWLITKKTDCPGFVSRSWRGANGYEHDAPVFKTVLPETKEAKIYLIETPIPEDAPTGKLRLTVRGWYECGNDMHPFELGPVHMVVE